MTAKSKVRLFGLPACGRQRLQKAWLAKNDFAVQVIEFAELLQTSNKQPAGFNLMVIDARSFMQLPRDAWLQDIVQKMLAQADAILLNFLEAASLEQQMEWKRYLQHNTDKPLFLSLNHAVPESLLAQVDNHNGSQFPSIESSFVLQSFEFSLEQVNLEHLMMVLDNAKTALGAKLLRAKAVLDTVEYDNLVALEGAPYRWDCYPATESEVKMWQNRLMIQGFDLDQAWLEQMLDACRS